MNSNCGRDTEAPSFIDNFLPSCFRLPFIVITRKAKHEVISDQRKQSACLFKPSVQRRGRFKRIGSYKRRSEVGVFSASTEAKYLTLKQTGIHY